jgi:hypothetical protein
MGGHFKRMPLFVSAETVRLWNKKPILIEAKIEDFLISNRQTAYAGKEKAN